MKHFLMPSLVLLSFLFTAAIPDKKVNFSFLMEECTVKGWLENIAGDTYAIKFKNNCDTAYRLYYEVVDKGKIIQETSTTIVKAKSENSTGTIHCSSEAMIKIIKKEKL
jgi:hypothetical protein